MEKIINILKTTDKVIYKTLQIICIFCFTILTILVTGNVIIRFLSKIITTISMHWFDEIVEWSFASLIFYGAGALWMTNEHFKLDVFKNKITNRYLRFYFNIIIELIVLTFIIIFAYQGFKLTILANDWSNIFRIPRKLYYMSLPISGIIMIIYSIRNIVVQFKDFILSSSEKK